MTESTENVLRAAGRLSPTERLDLVEQILNGLDATDPALDAQWVREAEDRLAAYRRGDIQAIPVDQVLAKYRQP